MHAGFGGEAVPFAAGWDLQRQVHARRVADEVPDSCLLLEHEPAYTAGKRTAASDRPVGDPTDQYDLQDVVQRALGRLPRQMRVAVILRYYDDLTEPEVSATMGVTVGTVKSTVARALAKLRTDEQLCADIAPYRDGAVFRVPAPRQDGDPNGAASTVTDGAPGAVPGAMPGQRGVPGQRGAPAPGAAAQARPPS